MDLNFVAEETWIRDNYMCSFNDKIVRIGSNSMRAMVFRVFKHGKYMACKFMFSTEENPENKNLNEISITQKLGDLYPDYFCKLYYVESCDNYYIPEKIMNQEIEKSAKIWHIRTKILPLFLNKPQIKKMEIAYRNGDEGIYKRFIEEKGIRLNSPVLLMYLELGLVDLSQWDSIERSVNEWIKLIYNVLSALVILRNENITHNDLHHGNILIMKDGKVKIIDLGESLQEYIKNYDLYKFIDGFRFKTVPQEINIIVNYIRENAEYKSLEEIMLELETIL